MWANERSWVHRSGRSPKKNKYCKWIARFFERIADSLIFGQKTSGSLGKPMSEFPALIKFNVHVVRVQHPFKHERACTWTGSGTSVTTLTFYHRFLECFLSSRLAVNYHIVADPSIPSRIPFCRISFYSFSDTVLPHILLFRLGYTILSHILLFYLRYHFFTHPSIPFPYYFYILSSPNQTVKMGVLSVLYYFMFLF